MAVKTLKIGINKPTQADHLVFYGNKWKTEVGQSLHRDVVP